jgi:hypothetical protein
MTFILPLLITRCNLTSTVLRLSRADGKLSAESVEFTQGLNEPTWVEAMLLARRSKG